MKSTAPHWLESCPLCNGSNLMEFRSASDPHYGIPGTYSISRCADCLLTFTNPMLSDEGLANLYPAGYYAYQEPPGSSELKQFCKRLLGYWRGTKDPRFDWPGAFLDIGCGSGTHVSRMKALGWDSYGVETNTLAANMARQQDLKVFPGRLEQAQFPDGYFDYVRVSHSLEHMTRPQDVLEEIGRILKPTGKLLIAVPNIQSLTARVFGRYWWHLCPPLHAFSYSDDTIRRLLKEHGFKIERLSFNSDYVGLLGSLQIWINRKNRRTSSDGIFFRSRPLRVLGSWMERLFDLFHWGDMIEVTAVPATTSALKAQQASTSSKRELAGAASGAGHRL